MKKIERSKVVFEALRKSDRSSGTSRLTSRRIGDQQRSSRFSQGSGKFLSQGRIKFKGRKPFSFRSNFNPENSRRVPHGRQGNQPAGDTDRNGSGSTQEAMRENAPKCYRCGQIGHIAPNCPNPPSSGGSGAKGGGRGNGKSGNSRWRGRGSGGRSR